MTDPRRRVAGLSHRIGCHLPSADGTSLGVAPSDPEPAHRLTPGDGFGPAGSRMRSMALSRRRQSHRPRASPRGSYVATRARSMGRSADPPSSFAASTPLTGCHRRGRGQVTVADRPRTSPGHTRQNLHRRDRNRAGRRDGRRRSSGCASVMPATDDSDGPPSHDLGRAYHSLTDAIDRSRRSHRGVDPLTAARMDQPFTQRRRVQRSSRRGDINPQRTLNGCRCGASERRLAPSRPSAAPPNGDAPCGHSSIHHHRPANAGDVSALRRRVGRESPGFSLDPG